MKPRIHYIAEAIREAGILILVFGPMYVKFDMHLPKDGIWTESLPWFVGGVILVIIGIELERRF